jgi:hypothetical protein
MEADILFVQGQFMGFLRGLPELTSVFLEFPDDTSPRRDWPSIAVNSRLVLDKLHTATLTGHHIQFCILAYLIR